MHLHTLMALHVWMNMKNEIRIYMIVRYVFEKYFNIKGPGILVKNDPTRK